MFWFNSRGYQVNVLETVIVNLEIQILDPHIPGILGNHINIYIYIYLDDQIWTLKNKKTLQNETCWRLAFQDMFSKSYVNSDICWPQTNFTRSLVHSVGTCRNSSTWCPGTSSHGRGQPRQMSRFINSQSSVVFMLWRIPMATGPVYVPILIDGHKNQLRIRNMLGKSNRPMNPRGPFGISMLR